MKIHVNLLSPKHSRHTDHARSEELGSRSHGHHAHEMAKLAAGFAMNEAHLRAFHEVLDRPHRTFYRYED